MFVLLDGGLDGDMLFPFQTRNSLSGVILILSKIDIVRRAVLSPCAGADALDLSLDEEPLLGRYLTVQQTP